LTYSFRYIFFFTFLDPFYFHMLISLYHAWFNNNHNLIWRQYKLSIQIKNSSDGRIYLWCDKHPKGGRGNMKHMK
jgi:hypothetical protein